jgi:hypothetical protein
MTTIDSNRTSDRTDAHDVMAMERWPVACVLMWIRAVRRGWSMLEVCDHLRRSLKTGEGAFPVDDYPFEEIKVFTDVAGASDAKLDLFHVDGKVEAWQLGPEARILPTKDPSGRLTFCLFPHPPIDISARLLGLWCHRRQAQAAWPLASDAADRPTGEDRCEVKHGAPQNTARKSRAGGRKKAYPWAAARVDVMKKLKLEGPPIPDSGIKGWQHQADLERFIAAWMIKRLGADVKQPASSTIRTYASLWLKEWSAAQLSA